MDALPNDMIRLIYWHYVKCDTSRGFWRLADARVSRLCEQPRPVHHGHKDERSKDATGLSTSRLLQAAYDGHAKGLDYYYTHQAFAWSQKFYTRTLLYSTPTDLEHAIAVAIIQGDALRLWPAWRNVGFYEATILYYGLPHDSKQILEVVCGPDVDTTIRRCVPG